MTTNDLKPLDPPDPKRCQAETIERTPWALGGTHRRTRCNNQPAFIATETHPGEDGRLGSMSLCPACKEEFLRLCGPSAATYEPIKATS